MSDKLQSRKKIFSMILTEKPYYTLKNISGWLLLRFFLTLLLQTTPVCEIYKEYRNIVTETDYKELF